MNPYPTPSYRRLDDGPYLWWRHADVLPVWFVVHEDDVPDRGEPDDSVVGVVRGVTYGYDISAAGKTVVGPGDDNTCDGALRKAAAMLEEARTTTEEEAR